MAKHSNKLASLVLLASGALIGVASTLLYKELRPKKPNQVLEEVKATFSEYGKITGSWIDYDAIEYDVFDSKPLVYLGGISREEEGKIVTYNFVCDAYTGEIIDVYEYMA